jgi:cell division septation protein DedD
MTSRWFALAPWIAGLVLALGMPSSAEGQSAALSEVREAVEEARYAEARVALQEWWEERASGADRATRQEALWLRARLTPEPQVAELDYRRLVIEYPGGSFSDGALLRLAQGAEARGEAGVARRYLEILVRDYPRSEHRVEARDRLARLPADADPEEAGGLPAPTPVDTTAEAVADTAVLAPPTVIDDAPPVTEPDSVVEAVLRPDTISPPPPVDEPVETVVPPADPPVEEDPEEEGVEDGEVLQGDYTVQLGAFSTAERAEELAGRARDAGLTVRVVQVEGSALFRVRMGGFTTRSEAEIAARGPRDLGFEALVSTDRESERTP